MREIKFRAWDKKGNNYFCKNISVEDFYKIDYEMFKNLEFEQYTGLKDKNGKEIYEGDIVIKKVEDCENCKPDYECGKCPTIENMRDVVSLEFFRYWLKNESFGYEGENLISPEDCEVIGNRYENPELLK